MQTQPITDKGIAAVNTPVSSPSDESSPWVSIIVPVFNVDAYLSECVDSILSQTFENFEILLVDDGSTDDSGKICDHYAKSDLRVNVIHKENEGVSAARNIGLEAAKGIWTTFVDSDDWVEQDWLAELFANVQRAEFDLLLFGKRKIQEGRVIYESRPTRRTFTSMDFIVARDFHANTHVWSFLFRTVLILERRIRFPVGMKFAEDTEFLMKYISVCSAVSTSDSVLYNYRHRHDSAVNLAKIDFSRAATNLQALNHFLAFCDASGIEKTPFEALMRKCYRVFLVFYLRDNPARSADKARYRELYRSTLELHPEFKRNMSYRFLSMCWIPSLTLVRWGLSLKHALHQCRPERKNTALKIKPGVAL